MMSILAKLFLALFQQPITNYCGLQDPFSWMWCIAEDLSFPTEMVHTAHIC